MEVELVKMAAVFQGSLPGGGGHAVYAQVIRPHPHLHAEGRQQRHRGRDPTYLPEGGAICLQEEHGEFRGSVILLCRQQDDYSELLLMV